MISTVVSDSPNKLFVAGLPNYLNDEQVKVNFMYVQFSTTLSFIILPYRCRQKSGYVSNVFSASSQFCLLAGTTHKFRPAEGVQSGKGHDHGSVQGLRVRRVSGRHDHGPGHRRPQRDAARRQEADRAARQRRGQERGGHEHAAGQRADTRHAGMFHCFECQTLFGPLSKNTLC